MAKQLYNVRVDKHTYTRFPYYSVFISKVQPIPYSKVDSWNIEDVLSAMTGCRLKGVVTDIDGVLDFVEDTCIASRKVVAHNLRECGEFYTTRLVQYVQSAR
ncbi:MAG: hypothetical protein UFD47_05800 [Collinsella aerofaciens]|nr:hypothetical protein [Collinsella aerofaciens]